MESHSSLRLPTERVATSSQLLCCIEQVRYFPNKKQTVRNPAAADNLPIVSLDWFEIRPLVSFVVNLVHDARRAELCNDRDKTPRPHTHTGAHPPPGSSKTSHLSTYCRIETTQRDRCHVDRHRDTTKEYRAGGSATVSRRTNKAFIIVTGGAQLSVGIRPRRMHY